MQIRCPHCHNPIGLVDDAELDEVLCPSCGSSFNLIGGDATESYRSQAKTLGHFELIEQVGVGHFGSVWKARDTKLDRVVAVKIPRRGELDAADAEFFLREARAAAQLKHPNIVSVHEVGRDSEQLYIVSDFVDGANLKEWLSSKRLTPREAAELCATIADALHHAHEAGVVHRDLKPGNIMMDAEGVPHIMDFGLAKRDAGEITMTMEGKVLGTPAYMPPEQALGRAHEADRRSDVYSLGVILFELLTGELPFRGDKRMLLVQIVNDDSPSPRKFDSRIPRDLETICLKCLQKSPDARFHSAVALSEDLGRFALGEPIQARPVTALAHGVRWCRRNPALSVTAAIALAGLIATAAVSTFLAITKSRHFRELAVAEADVRNSADEASRLALGQGLSLCQQGDVSQGVLWLNQAMAVAPSGSSDVPNAARRALAHWLPEIPHLIAVVQLEDVAVATAIDADASTMLTLFANGQIRSLSTKDGELLASYKIQGIGDLVAAAFDGDGDWLITLGTDGTVSTIECSSWRLSKQSKLDGYPARVVVSRDSSTIAVVVEAKGSAGGNIHLLSRSGLEAMCDPIRVYWPLHAIELSSDGRQMVTASADNSDEQEVAIWNTASGNAVHRGLEHSDWLLTATFSADGRFLATGGADRLLKIWSTETGNAVHSLAHADWVLSASFSKDGKSVAVGCADGNVCSWQLTPSESNRPRSWRHGSWVVGIQRHDGSGLMVTIGDDKICRFWARASAPSSQTLPVLPDRYSQFRWITWELEGFGARFVPSAGNARNQRLNVHTGIGQDMRLTSGSNARARMGRDGAVFVERVGGVVRAPIDGGSPNYAIESDKKQIATVIAEDCTRVAFQFLDRIKVWDVDTAQPAAEFQVKARTVLSMEISPGGEYLCTASDDNRAILWSIPAGRTVGAPMRHDSRVVSLAFDRTAKRLFTGTRDGFIYSWNVETQTLLSRTPVHTQSVLALALSKDGQMVVSGGQDGVCKVLDSSLGQPPMSTMYSEGAVLSVAVSSDNTLIVTGDINGSARLWDLRTAGQIAPSWMHDSEAVSVFFSPDNKKAIVSTTQHGVHVWPIARTRVLSADEYEHRIRLVTGVQLGGGGEAQVLSPSEWRESLVSKDHAN